LVDAKGTLQRYYCQNPFVADCFTMELRGWGSPTSNMSLPAKVHYTSVTPPAQDSQDLKLQDSMMKMLPSPPAQDPRESATPPPAQDTQELEVQDSTGKGPPSPPTQDPHSHPSTEQPELLPSTERETPQPLLATQ
jgi:hypothetical protein